MRWSICFVASMLLLFAASVMLQGPGPVQLLGIRRVHAASISITLAGCVVPTGTCTSAGWFEGATKDPTITVTQGDTVTLHLSSADRITHQFIVDVDGTGVCSTTDPCSSMFSSGTTFTFIANIPSGTHSYGCTIHPEMYVTGGFIVNPAPPDFNISASPSTVSTNVGTAANSTITVTPQNGFTGTVNLAAATNSTDLSCTLSPASISGGSGSSRLSCKSIVMANYLANATGTSGSLSHSAMVVVKVTTSGTTGGELVPVDKLGILQQYIGVGSVFTVLLATALILVRRRSRQDNGNREQGSQTR